MCNLSWLSNPVLASLLGVAVGGIVGAVASYLLSEFTERTRTRRLNIRRRNAAYRLLQGVLEEVQARHPIASAQLTVEEHRRIIGILADYHDVVFDETIRAWDTTPPAELTTMTAYPTYGMNLGHFANEVRIHYDRLRPENPAHQEDEQNPPRG